MDREALEKRKKIVYEFICDDLYVPMKAKEIATVSYTHLTMPTICSV